MIFSRKDMLKTNISKEKKPEERPLLIRITGTLNHTRGS
jgi:hypothetical protein